MRYHLNFVLTALVYFASSASADKPNILIILADDMGYGDMGCMGSQHLRTPHLDALAKSGVLCTQAYVASSVCSPSRAGLLTGRDPRRFGYEGNLNQGAEKYATRPELLGLPPGEHTLGDHLKAAAYTTALVGKWHQGTGPEFHPNKRGFDHFCGMLGGSHNYFPGKKNKLERNGEPLTDFSSPYLTDFFTDEALRWLRKSVASARPWFLYLSYNAPHGPLQATEEDLALFEHIQDRKRRIYAAMMFAMDRGIGRIRTFLQEKKQLQNTLIVFFSDNGGATGNASWNGPLSGVKGCMKEGGIRVPMIWSWPGTVPAGAQSTAVMSSLDLLPTFMAACGAPPLPLASPGSHIHTTNRNQAVEKYGAYDGINLLPVLKGTAPIPARRLFWRLQGQAAVLDGNDKLVRLSHRPAQMFHPASDPGEETDFSTERAARFMELFQQLGQWEATLPTVPLWGSSPYWRGSSAQNYDGWPVRPEPK